MYTFIFFLLLLIAVGVSSKARGKPKIFGCLASVLIVWLWIWKQPHQEDGSSPPLVRELIDLGVGRGGRWYIPPSWTAEKNDLELREPQTPAEAATLALGLAITQNRFLNNTKIPLIVHQTWKNLESHTWPPLVRGCVDEWLQVAVGGDDADRPATAYIMWDDEGMDDLFKVYEEPSWNAINMMPYKVEKADAFRVAVLKWFGGVYADVDTRPLRHPSQWVQGEDIQPWKDPKSSSQYALHEPKIKSYQPDAPPGSTSKADSWADNIPADYKKVMERNTPDAVNVAAIAGIECDTYSDRDDFWRMGYSYAVQLTNWAMAMAPHHPLASRYLTQVTSEVMENTGRLKEMEILDLTGPPAFTKAVKAHCEWDDSSFNWDSISGLADPPRSKGKVVAGDVLVLPITGFSPGRSNSWPHEGMGSQALDHPQARLYHAAAGSWRHTTIKIETGKLCRTLFGLCRDWKKIP